ncbi:MAG: methyltransferase domain-containing protein [Patescibacteria group bacterium]|nr:methyltransferase domain-containing protein [Patescibacteria group bacterium]
MKKIERVKNDFLQIDDELLKSLIINDYNNIAEIYDETMGSDFADIIYNSHLKTAKEQLANKSQIKCLDIACGTGSFIRRLAKELGDKADCYGMDLSEGQIAKAREKAEEIGAKVAFSVGNMMESKFEKECDLITINLDALNHLRQPEDWETVFKKIFDSLNNGGVFLFDINTQKRLLEDLIQLEVILKKDLTYVQCGVNTGSIDDFALNQHLMQIFRKEDGKIKEYLALIQQIAPTNERLFEMLKNAGFTRIEEIEYELEERVKHIFMKNRLFVKCSK